MKKNTQSKTKVYEILLLDDDSTQYKLLSFEIEKYNFSMTYVSEGKKALELLRTKKFDLIISDLLMPSMNGFDFIAEAKSYISDTPLIMLTASGDKSNVAKASSENVKLYLLKPIRPSKVLDKITEVLSIEKQDLLDKSMLPFKFFINEKEDGLLHFYWHGCPVEPVLNYLEPFLESESKILQNGKDIILFIGEEFSYNSHPLKNLESFLEFMEERFPSLANSMQIHSKFLESMDRSLFVDYPKIQKYFP